MNKYKRNEKRNYNLPSFQNQYQKFTRRKKLTQKERMCLVYYYETGDRDAAYMKAFAPNSRAYAHQRVGELLQTERAKKYMEELMRRAMRKTGIDDEYMLKQGKKAIEEATGEKKVPGLTFMEKYTGLGEANKKQLPGVLPRGLIPAGEIPIIDIPEEQPALPAPEIHHGDIIDEDTLPELGEESDTG